MVASSEPTVADWLLPAMRTHYGLEPIGGLQPLSGGGGRKHFPLGTNQQTPWGCICPPPGTPESLAYEHRLVRYLQRHLPQAPAPLSALDGSTHLVAANRLYSLLPLMPGAIADREAMRLPAAGLLAEFHQVGLAYPDRSPRPTVPAWQQWDWCEPNWPAILNMLASQPATEHVNAQRFWQAGPDWGAAIIARRQQIVEERANLQRWLGELAASGRPLSFGPIHDDYHRKNLLVKDGAITALLDWDGCHPDWLALDLAVAMWEFCLDKRAHSLRLSQAHHFLQTYLDAGGAVPRQEFDLLMPLLRFRRILEILTVLAGILSGEAWDASHAEYLLHNLQTLENLRSLQL